MSFDSYYGFVARSGSFENCDVKPYMAMCHLLGLKYYDVKLYDDVVLSMVRIEMVEWSLFLGKWVILWLCTIIVEELRCKLK